MCRSPFWAAHNYTISFVRNYAPAPLVNEPFCILIWTNADPIHWRIYAALGRRVKGTLFIYTIINIYISGDHFNSINPGGSQPRRFSTYHQTPLLRTWQVYVKGYQWTHKHISHVRALENTLHGPTDWPVDNRCTGHNGWRSWTVDHM